MEQGKGFEEEKFRNLLYFILLLEVPFFPVWICKQAFSLLHDVANESL
jgi:hypothetical protein